MRLPFLVTCLVVALSGQTHADGWIEIDERSRRTLSHRPSDRHARPAMQVTRHAVDIDVDGPTITVSVDESFHNPYPRQLEGTYYFPLPAGAHVEDFRVTLGDVELVGEIMERDKARQIYRDLVRRAIDPAILEYFQRDLVRARVFPIPANGDVRLKISYRQTVRRNGGIFQVRYPLSTGRFSAGSYRNVTINATIKSDEPIKSVYSPSHNVSVRRSAPNRAEVSFAAKELLAHADFVLELMTASDALAGGVRTYRTAGDDGFFMLRLSPGQLLPTKRAPVNMVFVVDTSGSMAGEKLANAKQSLLDAFNRFDSEDRFTVLTFSAGVALWSNALESATPKNLASARKFVHALRARGGTDIQVGLEHGLNLAHGAKDGATVMLVSDGAPTVGVTDPRKIIDYSVEKNQGDHRLHVFGVGKDVKTMLLDEIARRNGGSRTYLSDSRRLEVSITGLLDKVLYPCLSDIQVTANGLVLDRFEPEGPYDLFFGEDLILTGRYVGQGTSQLEVAGVADGERRVFVFPVEFASNGGNEEAAFLWAENRIDSLLEELRAGSPHESSPLRAEIVTLGLRFGIVTPFTASLIQESNGAVANALRGQIRRNAGVRREAASAASGFFERDRASSFDYSQKLGEKKKSARSLGRTLLHAESKSEAAALGKALRIRHAGGKGFIPIAGVYVDGALQSGHAALPKPDRVLEYGSQEYFALLVANPNLGPILAVGRSLLFDHNGTVIKIKDVELSDSERSDEPESPPKPPKKYWF